MNVKQIEKNKKIVDGVAELIIENKKDIEKLKANNGHKDPNKVQTISVLRDITFKLEMIMDIK
ncbi:MAG: hypothetical protein WC141_09190 [Arcobacteraceae bacterium]